MTLPFDGERVDITATEVACAALSILATLLTLLYLI